MSEYQLDYHLRVVFLDPSNIEEVKAIAIEEHDGRYVLPSIQDSLKWLEERFFSSSPK